MKNIEKSGQPNASRPSFKRRRIHCAALLALGPALTLQASAQNYVNYDGSKTNDFNAAVATWTNNAEFKSDWGLGAMNGQFAYALGFSGKGVKVGAVDSGLRLTHQEFASKGATALAVTGTYANDGSQFQNGSQPWKAGDSFNTTGAKNPLNDNHGSHVSGTIAGAKNDRGMMGVAFGSDYLITNSNGTDGSIYGANMDYNYFKAAYGNLAAAGVRVINSSWGTPDSRDRHSSVADLKEGYERLQGGRGKKSWLDAAADVAKETNVLQVWAAGNKGGTQINVRSALPYFRPELEQNWVTSAALNKDLTLANFSNQCGVAKYWCVSAPGVDIKSLDSSSDTGYIESSGTSMAAPHVTGALGVLMERYPSLDNQAVRTILLTTAKHLGDGPADVPNAKFGWGVPDLKKAMYGPSQFLGVFKANLTTGIADTWSNNISEAALIQRKTEDIAEVAAWTVRKAALGIANGIPANLADTLAAAVPAKIPAAVALVKKLQETNHSPYTGFDAAQSAVNADPVAKALLSLYEKNVNADWNNTEPASSEFTNYMATFADTAAIAQAALAIAPTLVQQQVDAIKAEYHANESRSSYLSSLTAANYVGSLVKTGAGKLTLTGDNSYSGGTQLQGGTLGVGSSTALGTGTLSISNATTLQAAADGLTLANAVTLSGIGNIDTQGYEMTLSGAISDGATSGGLAKLGTGTLTLSGANTYSGPTGVMDGTLRAGSATSFSPRSAFVVALNGQLDLSSFNQTIGSLSGAGSVSLGAATLTTGSDNSTTTFSGQIAGSGGLTKAGSGTFTLASAGNNGASGTGALTKNDSTSSGNTYSGATTVAAGTLQAGAVNTFSPASTMAVNAGAILNLAGYSQRVAGMNLAGTVSLAGGAGTVLIVTGPWTGSGGLLKLGTVSPAVSDRVLLSGTTAVASGTTTVQIGNVVGLGSATTGNGIELIGTTGGASLQSNAFVLAGEQLVGGAYEYRLNNISSGGYLSSFSPQGQTYYRSEVPQYSALPVQLRQASLTMLGNMHQRTGDDDVKTASVSLAGTDSTSSNDTQRRAWGRLFSTNLDIHQSGTVSPQSHGRLDGFQAGTDLLSVRNWRAGFYVGQLDGDMGVNGFARGIQNLRVGRNDLRNQYLGAYGTYSTDNGFYADAVLQAGRHRYDIVSPLTQSGSGGSGKVRSLLASVEVGRSFALDGVGTAGDWKVEPQLQLIHQRLSLDDVAIAGNTVVRQRPDSAWLARLGVRVEGEVGVGVGVGVARLRPYARFNLYHASGGNDVTSFMAPGGRTSIASSTGGTSAELAAGATLALTPTFALYGELGKLWSAGGDTRVKSSVQGSLGARVLW